MPLLTDGAAGTVAAQEGHLIAEWQKLRGDRIDQRRVIAARNVAASDRAPEQNVAHDQADR